MDGSSAICFQCGQATVLDAGRLNHLDDGRPCPACSERLMASLRPLLPNWEDEPAAEMRHEPRLEVLEPGPDAEPA